MLAQKLIWKWPTQKAYEVILGRLHGTAGLSSVQVIHTWLLRDPKCSARFLLVESSQTWIVQRISQTMHEKNITPQRYTQMVKGSSARSVYLLFFFPMFLKRYFSKNKQNWRELRSPCSQNCPNFNREIKIQALYPIFCVLRIRNLLELCVSFFQAW